MLQKVTLDGITYELSFNELVNISKGNLMSIDLDLYCNTTHIIEEARELLINEYSNSEQQWNEAHLSIFYIDEDGKLSDDIPF